jgi:hypothetical protein
MKVQCSGCGDMKSRILCKKRGVKDIDAGYYCCIRCRIRENIVVFYKKHIDCNTAVIKEACKHE